MITHGSLLKKHQSAGNSISCFQSVLLLPMGVGLPAGCVRCAGQTAGPWLTCTSGAPSDLCRFHPHTLGSHEKETPEASTHSPESQPRPPESDPLLLPWQLQNHNTTRAAGAVGARGAEWRWGHTHHSSGRWSPYTSIRDGQQKTEGLGLCSLVPLS